MSAILRQSYLEKIERYLGKDTIIILTGQRRIGKSYILRLFRDKVNKDEQSPADPPKAEAPADADVEKYDAQTAVLPVETFDYVVPEESYKKHRSRRHSSQHSVRTKTATISY